MAKTKKDYETPLSKKEFVGNKPWWADLWDKGQLSKEQENLILEGKSDLAKEIQIKAEQDFKRADRYTKLGKAVDTADTAVTAASLLTGIGAIPKIGSKILAKKSSKEPMSKSKIGSLVSDTIKKFKGKKSKPKPKRETSSKRDPKKTGDIKDLTTEKVPSRPKRRTTSTEADPKIDMKSLDKAQKEAGLLPKTKGDRAKRVVSKIPKLAPTIPELASYGKTGVTVAGKGLYRGLSSPLGRGIIKRSPLPIALGVAGYDYLKNKKEKEPVGTGTPRSSGGFGIKGPSIEELLRGASPEQRAAYYRRKAGEPQEAAKQADPEINENLRDQIFGEQTDDRSFAELMKDPKFSGDKAGATTSKPTTRSRPSPDSPLSYLRTDDEVEARNLSVRERMGKEQRGRRLDAEARFRERKDFMEQSKKLKDPNLIEGPQGEVLGRVIKDSTGRIIGSSLNKAGRAAMGNRKGAGVIDGSMRDTALGLDKRDEQIASMVAAQKDVADMFYSKSGGSRGSGATPAPKATAVTTGDPVVTFGSSSQYNRTSKSSPAPRAIPVDKGYVEGQGGYGLPAPNTTDVPDAPRAIPVNTPAPRATAVKPSTPSDVALGNQFGSMDMNPPNNPSISPPPAEVQKKPMQTGRAELPEDEGSLASDALFPKTPIASAVSELVKKKKKK